jgi:hypothetical protein
MKNFHIIGVQFIGPSNSRGSRIKISSYRFGDSITVPYDYTYNSALDQASNLLKRLGYNVIGTGAFSEKHDTVVTDTFESLKQMVQMQGSKKNK